MKGDWPESAFRRALRRQPTLPFQPHSDESKEAAKLHEPKAGTERHRVWSLLRSLSKGHAGLTDDDIQDALMMDASTERPRRVELVKLGLVEKNPDQTGVTKRGRKAALWRAV